MNDFEHLINFTKLDDSHFIVKVNYHDGRLSIQADIYQRSGDRWKDVGGGQCLPELLQHFPESTRLIEVWSRWHLNDINAGDETQESYLRALRLVNGAEVKNYKNARDALDNAGLLIHNGYEYGTDWLKEEVPESVLNELKTMSGVEK